MDFRAGQDPVPPSAGEESGTQVQEGYKDPGRGGPAQKPSVSVVVSLCSLSCLPSGLPRSLLETCLSCCAPLKIPVNCDFSEFLPIGKDLKEDFPQKAVRGASFQLPPTFNHNTFAEV